MFQKAEIKSYSQSIKYIKNNIERKFKEEF